VLAVGCGKLRADATLFHPDGERELTCFSFPRQNMEGGPCIADFFRDVSSSATSAVTNAT